MIIVTIELLSALDGRKEELGRMHICNRGDSKSYKRGNYNVEVFRKGTRQVLRTGAVEDYPRLSYNVWRLICRALKSAFPEEK